MGSGLTLSVVGHRLGVQRNRKLWSCDDQRGALFQTKQQLCHNCPTHLSHKCPPIVINASPIISSIPISPLSLTSQFMCVQIFHMNMDMPASVGAPPLDTQLTAQTIHINQCKAKFYVVCVAELATSLKGCLNHKYGTELEYGAYFLVSESVC